MLSVKEKMLKIIQEQPEESSYEEILRELAFRRVIERGLIDSQALYGNHDEDLQRKIKSLCLGMLMVDERVLKDVQIIQSARKMMHSLITNGHEYISFKSSHSS